MCLHSLGVSAPGTNAPGAVPSLRECGLFDHRGDCIGMNDERSMTAGDFRRLRLHPGCEKLLGLRCDYLVLGGDHVERWLVAPGGNVDGGFERKVVLWKLRVGQVLGDFGRKVSSDG
jgi:hypothetical protein